ncbi:MAG: TetR/AcrR family transcriptional regulator [Eubacteriales bacterium]|nr:TetR/AcrR family transcriptional regulator [Eubacteriales bacterium]
MDIRIAKTRRSIINAFLEIRAHKDLERITVKELCQKAQINKSTFYSHYCDIYDLSDQLENEVVASISENLQHPEEILKNPAAFTKELFLHYMAKDALIGTLFSGSRSKYLVQKIAQTMETLIFDACPHYRDDPRVHISLTYMLYGGYYAFYENRTSCGDALAVSTIAHLTELAAGADFFFTEEHILRIDPNRHNE